ncbi:MAG: hypothetical protein AAF799_44640 [Myxococcota bacterium]
MPRVRRATSKIGLVGALGAFLGLLTLGACDEETGSSEDRASMEERIGDVLPVVVPQDAPLPADRAEILRELAPLPSDALVVVFEVQGPGGLEGTLEVLARPGGYRRENWTLEVPLGREGTRRLAGSTIQTPDGVWMEGTAPETFTSSPLGALADAYLELDEEHRREVMDNLRGLRSTLAEARGNELATPEKILGVPCHDARVATIDMCLWEATGLPLRYDSEGLKLRALNIDTKVSIGEHAFDLPFATSGDANFDAEAALARLAEGDLSELAPLLHPGLRMPHAV